MEKERREYNKKTLEKLIAEFPAAHHKYLCDSIDEANNARSDEEWERITNERMPKEQHFIEYLLDHGVVIERTGYWVCGNDDQDYWTCSECGFPVMAADDWCDPYEAEIECCEKCGARMLRKKD